MIHYVYVIYSASADKFYKGYSLDPERRLYQHNLGKSRYTKNFVPWELVFVQHFDSKRDALIREKALKKYGKNQLRDLMNSSLNQL